jgi:hypothetical protein
LLRPEVLDPATLVLTKDACEVGMGLVSVRWENHRKIVGKSWKLIGKLQENHGNTDYASWKIIGFSIVFWCMGMYPEKWGNMNTRRAWELFHKRKVRWQFMNNTIPFYV